MKLNSKYFDGIRAKADKESSVNKKGHLCEWSGCHEVGEHPAPKGRGRDGEYFRFCMKHVREYNKSYNYFNGMSDDQVADYQEQAVTGHRPTWKVGLNNGTETSTSKPRGYAHNFRAGDDFDLFDKDKDGAESKTKKETKKRRPIRTLERKYLKKLNLDDTASAEDIKASFKGLVKQHHPDLNGGDRDSEERLREIIQAYNYLKQVGLC